MKQKDSIEIPLRALIGLLINIEYSRALKEELPTQAERFAKEVRKIFEKIYTPALKQKGIFWKRESVHRLAAALEIRDDASREKVIDELADYVSRIGLSSAPVPSKQRNLLKQPIYFGVGKQSFVREALAKIHYLIDDYTPDRYYKDLRKMKGTNFEIPNLFGYPIEPIEAVVATLVFIFELKKTEALEVAIFMKKRGYLKENLTINGVSANSGSALANLLKLKDLKNN